MTTNTKKIRTIKELRDYIKDLPDDMPILHYEDGMEKHGFMDNACFGIDNMVTERVGTYDAFDGCHYTYERFTESDAGKPCLKIY